MKTPALLLVLATALLAPAVPAAWAWGASHSGSYSASDGHWSSSGSTSWTNRYGQSESTSHSGSGSYGDGSHSGSGSYNSSWGNSGSWNHYGGGGDGYHYGGGSYSGSNGSGSAYHSSSYSGSTYHYGSASYGGCYASGFHVGYVAPPPPVAPVGVAAVSGPAGGVAAVRVGPFVRTGYYRAW